MLFAFIVFAVFFVIGYFTSASDEEITRSILSDDYVDMTHDNIEKGNPFGVYESGNPLLSWLGIMINNIKVAVRDFVAGIFAGIPTFYSLGKFGIMVGAFDQMFAAKGLGMDFWMVVFVHGTLEITAFIITSTAGFVLGKSYLFPGTIRRWDAFKTGAKDGVKMLIGMMPVLALAAFFEGLFTRLYNDMPILTTLIVILSVLFVIWYFVIYPARVYKKLSVQLNEEEV